MTRDQLQNQKHVIDFHDIKQGDVIERWTPIMTENPDRPGCVPTGEFELFTCYTAIRNDLDLAGRWTNENGKLVHGGHDGIDDVPSPQGDFEILVISKKSQ